MKRILLCPLLAIALCASLQAQVVINEVDPATNKIELKNTGASASDVSGWWFCNFPTYISMANATVESGTTTIAPGSLLVLTVPGLGLSNADSELGLYTSSSFSSSAAIEDYIEWGSTGHQRSSVAVAAGTWTNGDFIAAVPSGEVIAYDGEGEAATDYTLTDTPTFGDENDSGASGTPKVVINEVDPTTNKIELYNAGNGNADVSGWWFCNFPTYISMGNSTIESGTTTLAPGDYLVVTVSGLGLDASDSELGLYNSSSFSSSSAIEDYIEWGSTSHQRSSVAVAAGTWTNGDFLPAVPAGEVIAYDGEGEAATDYANTTTATFGQENVFTTPTPKVVINEVDPTTNKIELYNAGNGNADVSGWWFCNFPTYISMGNSTIESGSTTLAPGDYLVVTVSGLGLDANDSELGLYNSSSFSSSNAIEDYIEWGSTGHQRSSVAVAAGTWTNGDFLPAVPAGEVIAYDGEGEAATDYANTTTATFGQENIFTTGSGCSAGTVITVGGSTTIQLCPGASNAQLQMMHNGSQGGHEWYVITDAADTILDWSSSDTLSFVGTPTGVCRVYGWVTDGTLTPVAGQLVSTLESDTTCSTLSSNHVTVIREYPVADSTVMISGADNFWFTCSANRLVEMAIPPYNGFNQGYIVADSSGEIVLAWELINPDIDPTSWIVDISNLQGERFMIYGWEYFGNRLPEEGQLLSDLVDDCSVLSPNAAIVEVGSLPTSTIALANGADSAFFCANSNAGQAVPRFTFDATLEEGEAYWLVVTTSDNLIRGAKQVTQDAGDTAFFDLSGTANEVVYIYGWAHAENVDNLYGVGKPVSVLDSLCGKLSSNFITLSFEVPSVGAITSTEGDTVEIDPPNSAEFQEFAAPSRNTKLAFNWVVTDSLGNLLGVLPSGNQISFEDSLNAGLEGPWRVYGWSHNGQQAVTLGASISALDTGNCQAISSNFIVVQEKEEVVSGLPQPAQALVAYPNPTTQQVHFGPRQVLQQLYIYNAQGILIWQGQQVEQLDVSAFAPGLYLLEAHTASGTHYRGRLVKQ